MDALTLVAAAVVALFWAIVSIFAPFLPEVQPPPAATSTSKRHKRPRGAFPDLAAAALPTAQVQPPPATRAAVVPETASESSSLFSTAPGSLISDNDTNNEPHTPAPSEELVTPSSSSSGRPYRKFSDFKVAFAAPFAKKRSATLDLPPNVVMSAKPRRDRSRSSSRSRAPFAAIFGSSRSQVSSPVSEDIPLTPESVSSGAAIPEKVHCKAKRPRGSLPLNLPPLSRLHQRRVSAPAPGPSTCDSPPASTSDLVVPQSTTSSLAEDRAQLQSSDTSATPTQERGRDRGRRALWKRAFSKRNDSDNATQHDHHEKSQNTKKQKPRASSVRPDTPSAPSDLHIDTDVERRIRFSEDAPPCAPVRSQTWLERREARVHRTRARSVDPKPDRHAVSARIAQEAWGRPLTPSPIPVAPT